MQRKPLIHEIVPEEIIDYFLEGRYAGRQGRSQKYNHLAWSLSFRGIYAYSVTNDNKGNHPHHCGFCVIDIQPNGIKLGGIRVLQLKKSKSPHSTTKDDLEHTVRVWKSELATLEAENLYAELKFVYALGEDKVFDKSKIWNKNSQKMDIKDIYDICSNRVPMPKPDESKYIRPIYDYLGQSFFDKAFDDKTWKKKEPSYALVSLRREYELRDKFIVGDYRKIPAKLPGKSKSSNTNSTYRQKTVPFSYDTTIKLTRI